MSSRIPALPLFVILVVLPVQLLFSRLLSCRLFFSSYKLAHHRLVTIHVQTIASILLLPPRCALLRMLRAHCPRSTSLSSVLQMYVALHA